MVEAALALIDREGVEALTMRRLAGALGVEAMSLYEYTRGKDELLVAMYRVDSDLTHTLEELELPLRERTGWKERIYAVVDAWLRLAEQHPNSFPLLYRERPFAARDLHFPEEIYAALRAAGFDEEATVTGYGAIALFVNGALMRGSPATSGTSSRWDDAPSFEPADFPRISELLPFAHPLTWRQLFDRGLSLLLAGLELELAAAKAGRTATSATPGGQSPVSG